MALTSLLLTARDALNAQAYGVQVTSQNITNANTPGYVKREAVLQSRILGNETYGTVQVAGLRRNTDQFVEGRHISAVGNAAASTERDAQLSVLETVFNDLAGAGIGEALDRINHSFQQLSVDPSDTIGREDVLASLSDFVSRAHETGEVIASQRTEILNNMHSIASDINQRAEEIANLNGQIKIAVAQGKDAADLFDRRDQVLSELAPMVNTRVVNNDDGTILVQAAGATLVEGSESRVFSVDLDGSGNARLLASRTDGSNSNITATLTGGKMSGLIEVRDQDILAISSQLDEYVYEFATALNTQHQAGFSLDDQTGLNLFDLNLVGAPPTGVSQTIEVSVDVIGQPERIAASDSLATSPGSGENAKLITQVFDQPIVGGGTRTASEGYSDLVGEIGLRRANSQRESLLHEAMEEQFLQIRESVTGVSLDEEMVALTRFQRAYQAASRVLTTADELLEELLNATR